jgi:hypothetical protein
MSDAMGVIADWLAADWDDIGPASGPHEQGARILLNRLAAGFKVLARSQLRKWMTLVSSIVIRPKAERTFGAPCGTPRHELCSYCARM